ncbi:MAG: hypothetical protein L0I76_31275, partial [Pseudonocardia sp.]|nr:hypothetical protein [Pseudonocardia sp.]
MSDTVAAAPTAHELLLALAGWVDDDLLATGRELVAVGEEVPALELLVASLAAGRIALPEPVRAALVDTAVALRVEPHADRALPPGLPPRETTHRFAAGAGSPDVAVRVAGIGRNLPVVARSGARVSLAWRLTPAGPAPGPLPHPVLLAAVQAGGPVEVLAYQLGAALARAGIAASVEAFVDGTALPPYHLAAQAEALPLDRAADETAPGPGVLPDDGPQAATSGPASGSASASGPAPTSGPGPGPGSPTSQAPAGQAGPGPVDGPPGTPTYETSEHVKVPDGGCPDIAAPDNAPPGAERRDVTDTGPATATAPPSDTVGPDVSGGGDGHIAAGGAAGDAAGAGTVGAAPAASGTPDPTDLTGPASGPSGSPSGPAPEARPRPAPPPP